MARKEAPDFISLPIHTKWQTKAEQMAMFSSSYIWSSVMTRAGKADDEVQSFFHQLYL